MTIGKLLSYSKKQLIRECDYDDNNNNSKREERKTSRLFVVLWYLIFSVL
jgi:hypothetical protein